jgi:hypothetical protein
MTRLENPAPCAPALGQDDVPFFVSHDERVHVIKLELCSEDEFDEEELELVHCIPERLIRSYLPRMTKTWEDEGCPLAVAWSEWAVDGTRLLPYTTNSWANYTSRTYGSRYVDSTIEEGVDGHTVFRVTLYDFSQKGFRKGLAEKDQADDADGWDYHQGDDISVGWLDAVARRFFAEGDHSLRTLLPYRSTSRLFEVQTDAGVEEFTALLAEDNIILAYTDVSVLS